MRASRIVAAVFVLALPACGGGNGGGGGALPQLGEGADLQGWRPFPDDDPWNTLVDTAAVDPASDTLIGSIDATKHLQAALFLPYVVVAGTQPRVPVNFSNAAESDAGPYPIPPDAPIEGGPASVDDRHVLVIDRDAWTLYECFSAYPVGGGTSWTAEVGAKFDLSQSPSRPAGWVSTDRAGLPVFPGLLRYDEAVTHGVILHALRFSSAATRRAYVAPANHASIVDPTDASLPPMGTRVRLKASYDISGFSPLARVILTAMKRYGMLLADKGPSWFVTGAPDARWDTGPLDELKTVPGSAFEVVLLGPITPG